MHPKPPWIQEIMAILMPFAQEPTFFTLVGSEAGRVVHASQTVHFLI